MIFDGNDLAAVLDLKLCYEFIVVGCLVGEWAHSTGFVGATPESWFGFPGSHDVFSCREEFGAAEYLFEIAWSGVSNSGAFREDFLHPLVSFNHKVVVLSHDL